MDHQAVSQMLGNYGEFVGAIGVVVTLAYLAVQVRLSRQATDANTKVNRAASAALSQDSNAEINKLIATDASLAKIMTTALGQGSVDGLAPEEVFRWHVLLRAALQIMESTYFRYEEGILDPRIWTLRRTWTKSFIETAPVSDWWTAERESFNFTSEFINEIESGQSFALDTSGRRKLPE